ncbi:winged helix-turn-helix transcriptional regulator [Streptomyces scabiei]|uniref:Transcriptional regulatory protein WalR n=1 Tax=Streptomyces scabiei TaxID=1930 RepID=A0A117EE57_STRSC|nr:transcriptional regulatory protein WalR [Streptomyces scabiei]
MGVRVLLIEDDETIAEPLADGLRHFGLTVHHVATGADGLRGPYGDVVLLDLGLPDMDGIDVCRGIRRTSDVPLIILSARGEEADRVLGLELGADDYLAKPFSIRELVARIRAVSRRHQRPGGGTAPDVVAGVVVAEAAVGKGTGFGAENDFTAPSAFEAGNGPGSDDASRAGDEEPGRGGAGYTGRGAGPGDRSAGRHRAGPGVGARGAQYDWSAADETPAREAGAGQGYGSGAYGGPGNGSQAYASRAYDASAYGTPPHGTPAVTNPAYGTPAHGNPVYEPPAYEASVHEPPAYAPSVPQPPVYEPPVYEQAPPEPRPPSGPAFDDDGGDGSAPPPGPLVVDRRTRQVWVGEVPVALTPKEFELLALLTEDPGAVYSRQQILNRVWDDHYQGPTKTLDVHVATLRRKLGDPAWIQTLRGVGFRLAVRTPGQASGPGRSRPPSHEQGTGRGRGAGSGRHRTPETRAS